MNGAQPSRPGHEGARRQLPPHPPRRHDAPEQHLPQVGMEVAGYRLEATLGSGGQGTVFRARREDQLFAVKFISRPHAASWARRELDVMVKLWCAGGLPLVGHGEWPALEPRFLFLVTPYVRGLSLDAWAREHNPNALEVADLVRQAARLLGAVHAAGVVHRDVKGSNLLVYGERQLVLVDFGVATYEDAPRVTGPVPPGTWPYLSPRVWRSWRGEEDSRASPGDDLWALGVELYQLLTGGLPFRGSEGELVHAILHEEPRVPHELNPRVPRTLGEVCWRMLRKQPGERYADARAVEAALEEAVKQADEAWKVPLCEAWGPDNATTAWQEDMWREGADLQALYARLASYEPRLVRGKQRPPEDVSTQGEPEEVPLGLEALEVPLSGEEATRETVPPAPLVTSPPASSEGTARSSASELAKAEQSQRPRTPDVPSVRARRVLLVASAVLVLGLGVWFAARPPPRTFGLVTPPVGTPLAVLPPEFHPITLEPGGQEVAPPWRRPEGDGGAAPEGAATPAPVASATHSQDIRVRTLRKAPQDTPQQQPKSTGSAAAKAGAALLGCTLAAGCPGPTSTTAVQVRPLPAPTECPPGSLRTMEELGLRIGRNLWAMFPNQDESETFVPVREGPGTTMEIEPIGKLPADSMISGELFFGTDRIYGRFTQLHTPDGHTYPICMVLVDRGRYVGVGGDDVKPGEKPGTALISDSEGVIPVERFE
ncbi:protein kinase [Archangium violaceum]|uniref:serine/threonine protein kinase n=1 Tax=Archangium violaceum TaxID=83451 RepID=UPI0019500987|nr:serine/threonine-protein kinase [Archangium violaceum]QRN94904.1 protein kinase [Archangium violaceum]